MATERATSDEIFTALLRIQGDDEFTEPLNNLWIRHGHEVVATFHSSERAKYAADYLGLWDAAAYTQSYYTIEGSNLTIVLTGFHETEAFERIADWEKQQEEAGILSPKRHNPKSEAAFFAAAA